MEALGATSLWLGGRQVTLAPSTLPPLPPTIADRLIDKQHRTVWLRGRDEHTRLHPAQAERWADIASTITTTNNHQLRITVLGTSVTNGCGACDYTTLEAHPEFFGPEGPIKAAHNASICAARASSVYFCDATLSWVRIMHEELERTFGAGRIRTRVSAKNGVGPAYFSECTESKIDADTHVILIDVGTNLFAGSLSAMLTRIHIAAPNAAVVFVNWQFQTQCAGLAHEKSIDEAASSSYAAAADVLSVTSILRNLMPKRFGCPMLYAVNGHDSVHPNPVGHRLIAHATATFLLDRLLLHRNSSHPPRRVHAPTSTSTSTSAPPPPPQTAPSGLAALPYEVCYEDATRLPIAPTPKPTAWKLVDDAIGTGKGISKFGWVSEAIGESLTIGPLQGPPTKPCALLRVDVGYLLKMSPNQGDLLLQCTGCECAHDQDLTSHTAPFPRVPTDAAIAADPSLRRNMSVTATATFLMVWWKHSECTLTVHHVGHARPRSTTRSRVRVDSLTIHHRGVYGFAHKIFHHRAKYRAGLPLAEQLLGNSSRSCPEDCDGGWPCPGHQYTKWG